MVEYRLVCQVNRVGVGSTGQEITERTYILQTRGSHLAPWRTLPVVNWNTLSGLERDEVMRTLVPRGT